MATVPSKQDAIQVLTRYEQAMSELESSWNTLKTFRDVEVKVVDGTLTGTALSAMRDEPPCIANRFLPKDKQISAKPLPDLYTVMGYKGMALADSLEAPKNNSNAIQNAMNSVLEKTKRSMQLPLGLNQRTPDNDSIVLVVMRVLDTQALYDGCERLYAATKPYEREAEALKTRTGTIKWLFANRAVKEAAANAFAKLQALLSQSFDANAHAIYEAVLLEQDKTADDAWNDYFRRGGEYLRELDRIAPGGFIDASSIRELPRKGFSAAQGANAIGWFEETRGQLGRIQSILTVDAAKKQIEDAALDVLHAESMRQLAEIPISEINQGGRGMRVGVVANAGYETVADVMAASEYHLSSIKGISEDAARSIKRACKMLSEQLLSQTRIRLSTDNQSKEYSRLIAATYDYIRTNEILDKQGQIESELTTSYGRAASTIKTNGYGSLAWKLWDDQRDAIVDSFRQLEDGRKGDLLDRATQLLSSASTVAKGTTQSEAWNAFESSPYPFYHALEVVVPDYVSASGTYGLPEEIARAVQDQDFFPDGLLCDLRRYQEWGVKYILHQGRVLLGDEMGLGKTVQAIAAMVSMRNVGETHFLVVCPASVLINWCREVSSKSKLRVTKVYGYSAEAAYHSWRRTGGVAVTTYETTRKLETNTGDAFGLLVVDEAHYIKNPDAKRSQSVRSLCTHFKQLLFMTGTALENNVAEMIELMRVLQPEVARRADSMASLARAPSFREAVAPVYYRRKREDVLSEMPDLVESREWCSLTSEEHAVYANTVFARNFMAMRRVSWNISDPSKSSKAKRLIEIVEDAKQEGRKVLVFSYFRDVISAVASIFEDSALSPISGGVTPQRRQEILDEFEKAPAGSVLPAQIQAGGTGLNIQSASVVVICEPQIKPSIEMQAISRAYRMGQTRSVLVYRLLCENTVDEKVLNLLEAKQRQFDEFADKSVAAQESVELDKTSQNNIIEEEIERLKREREGEVPST